MAGQRFWRADYQRRERQRQKKNDEAQPSSEAAREEFFPAVESEARQNMLVLRRDEMLAGTDDAGRAT